MIIRNLGLAADSAHNLSRTISTKKVHPTTTPPQQSTERQKEREEEGSHLFYQHFPNIGYWLWRWWFKREASAGVSHTQRQSWNKLLRKRLKKWRSNCSGIHNSAAAAETFLHHEGTGLSLFLYSVSFIQDGPIKNTKPTCHVFSSPISISTSTSTVRQQQYCKKFCLSLSLSLCPPVWEFASSK